MTDPRTARIRARHTYAGYSVSCAAVWAVILAVGQRRLDPNSWNTLRLSCMGWWSGWTSATIARATYPPPKKLKPETEKRLAIGSIALIAVGLVNVIRLLSGKRQPTSAGDASGG